MSTTPPPHWAALYQKHRDAMYRVAARILRGSGRVAAAEDVVMAAMESLMKNPPSRVNNWEAVMVDATKRRALDLLKSAAVKHASSGEITDRDGERQASFEDDVIATLDRQRAAKVALDKLAILDDRHRHVASEYIAKGRPREDVATELGVSPSRVSQMASKALKQLKEALEEEGVKP